MVESIREEFVRVFIENTGKKHCTTAFGERIDIHTVAKLIKEKNGKARMSPLTGALIEAGEVRNAYRKAKKSLEKTPDKGG